MRLLTSTLATVVTLIVVPFAPGCRDDSRPPAGGLRGAVDLEVLAPTPPLGWNSYDAYDWRVNEAEIRANADFMAEHLADHGFQYVVVDYLWHIVDHEGAVPILERTPRSRRLRYDEDGTLLDEIVMDAYGRVMPDTVRFPSARGGGGFKALADYVHSRGLKFGIHIMRGIPRKAVRENLPIKGTDHTAADIAEPWDTSIWEDSMYGVDFEAPGSQAYYDSLIELYASWGVDFIKADDMMYPEFHLEEIRMLRRAIERVGHPIVLSLSLGEPQFHHAETLAASANMWRISDDFWDDWSQIERQWDLLNFWANYTRPGSWPDADMLPIGRISLAGHKGPARDSKLTWPEHRTLLSLWSIARSPLMMGGDLPTSSDSTLAFLSNDEVLYVNQQSENGHRVYLGWSDDTMVWIADDQHSEDRFFALFNVGDSRRDVTFRLELEHLRGTYRIRDLWEQRDLGSFSTAFTANLPPHGAGLYRMTETGGS